MRKGDWIQQEHLDAMGVSSMSHPHTLQGSGEVEMGPGLISSPRAAPDGTAWVGISLWMEP